MVVGVFAEVGIVVAVRGERFVVVRKAVLVIHVVVGGELLFVRNSLHDVEIILRGIALLSYEHASSISNICSLMSFL